MTKRIRFWLVAACCGMLAACAIITVNVYFPEKDVKQAYKSLDEMLLKQGGGGKDAQPATANPEPAAPVAPADKPQSRLLPGSFSLVGTAWAAEPVADELAVELSGMPEVLKAYDEMKARLPELNALRASGVVGETSQGLVTIRDKAKGAGKETLVKAENDNRKTVMMAMADALLKINSAKGIKADKNQLLKKASEIYAETKHDEAKAGWWVQLPNNRWVQK